MQYTCIIYLYTKYADPDLIALNIEMVNVEAML